MTSFWLRRPFEDLGRLDTRWRAIVRDAMETHLRHAPTMVSKSRIKKLRGMRRPGYRLRIDEIRVFYDVSRGLVEVLAVIPKTRASEWLAEWGETE